MSFLLASTLKVSAILVVGLLAAAVARRRSAAARHWIIAATLVCAMVLPLLAVWMPAWNILPGATVVAPSQRQPSVSALTTTAPPAASGVEVSDAVAVAGSPSLSGSWAVRWLTAAWLLGVALSLFVLACGFARLMWLASHARPIAAGAWTRAVEDLGRELSLRRPVRLLEGTHPTLLVTWGIIRPKILIPRAAHAWTSERITIVLRHELAHVRRGDWFVQICGEMLRGIYWFNPLVWMACARLREESEQACDDEVLTSGVGGPDYATHLVELARLLKAEPAPRVPAPAITRSSGLERRITAMLDARLTRTPATRAGRLLTTAALFSFTVALAAAQSTPVTLSGSVTDQTGAPVSGAAVTLSNERTGAKYQVTSDASGLYNFVPLPADSYALSATLPGFKQVAEPVTLTGKTMNRPVVLSLGELQETISIRGSKSDPAPTVAPSTAQQLDRSGFKRALEGCKAEPVGGRVRPPRKIKDVKPIYPQSAREAGVSGKVVLKATIALDGTVRDVQVVSSASPDLDNAAIEAVRQWQFDGTMLNCAPVEVTMNVSLDFGLQQH